MSIFATQLQKCLHRHGKTLGSLYNITTSAGYGQPVSAYQIQRLKQAATDDAKQEISVALNPDELEAVSKAFGFDQEDMRSLRLALLAEAVRRLLLGRISIKEATQIGNAVFRLLLDTNDAIFARYHLQLDAVRAEPEDRPASLSAREQQIAESIEPIVEIYEDAVLWLELARSERQLFRQRGYARMAGALLAEAKDLVTYPPGIIDGTEAQVEWDRLVTEAAEEAVRLSDEGA